MEECSTLGGVQMFSQSKGKRCTPQMAQEILSGVDGVQGSSSGAVSAPNNEEPGIVDAHEDGNKLAPSQYSAPYPL